MRLELNPGFKYSEISCMIHIISIQYIQLMHCFSFHQI